MFALLQYNVWFNSYQQVHHCESQLSKLVGFFLLNRYPFLRDSDLIKISTQIEKLYHSNDLDVESLCWLNYLLSFFPCCDTTILVSSVIFWSLCQLRQQLSQEKKVSILVPIIRFLGNVTAASNDYVVILLNENDFVSIILKLLNSSYEPICKETLLLVANIVNNPSSTVRLVLANVKFKETLEKSVCNVLALF